jgi:hypothetical protein
LTALTDVHLHPADTRQSGSTLLERNQNRVRVVSSYPRMAVETALTENIYW